MRVELLLPDVARATPEPQAQPTLFARAIDALGDTLQAAERSEDRYATHIGSLQDAVIDRARADVALSIATAAAQR
ncbi:MAG: hypothetical protein ACYDGM_09160, partial [Vulcanimicrobiaceae bacterium]